MQLLWCRVEEAAPSELYSALVPWDHRAETRLMEKLGARDLESFSLGLTENASLSPLSDFAWWPDTEPDLHFLLKLGKSQGWERAETAAAILVLCWLREAGVENVFSLPHRIDLVYEKQIHLEGLVVRPTGAKDDAAHTSGAAVKSWPAMAGLLRCLYRQGKLEYVSESSPPAFKILDQRMAGERSAVLYLVETFPGRRKEGAGVLSVGTGISHEREHMDEDMVILQANIDDMNPEWLPYTIEKLLQRGANDVYAHPILMKKGRMGTLLNVLCERAKCEALKEVMFSETSTIGVRALSASVHRLARTSRVLESPWGPIRVKLAKAQGKIVQAAPEYEDCRRIAQQRGIPLKKVYQWVSGKMEGMEV